MGLVAVRPASNPLQVVLRWLPRPLGASLYDPLERRPGRRNCLAKWRNGGPACGQSPAPVHMMVQEGWEDLRLGGAIPSRPMRWGWKLTSRWKGVKYLLENNST